MIVDDQERKHSWSRKVALQAFAILITAVVGGTTIYSLSSNDWTQFNAASRSFNTNEFRVKPWDIGPIDNVAIWIDNTIRYQLDNSESAEEYSHLLPSTGTTVYVADDSLHDPGLYTVALFHQLKCLDIIREDYTTGQSSKMCQHCLNYLRQSLLCLADTRLEPVRAAQPPNVVTLAGDYECKDWTALYKAAEAQKGK